MPLLRILVDGYSLLHAWPGIAPGRPRHSARAREELVHWLTQYQDAVRTPITSAAITAAGNVYLPNIAPTTP